MKEISTTGRDQPKGNPGHNVCLRVFNTVFIIGSLIEKL